MIERFLDFFFPRRSLSGEDGSWVTDGEWQRMRTCGIRLERDELRARGIMHIDTLVAACAYDDSPLVRTALRRFKYGGVRALGPELGRLLADYARLLPPGEMVLVPVPLHWRRGFARGFNQSQVLTQAVSARTCIPYRLLLRRTRATGQQAKRSREERLHAMHDAFTVCAHELPSHVVLVDDVATTCATLDACARALKSAGVMSVDALAVALG